MDFFSFDDEYVRRLLAGDRVVEGHFFKYFNERLLKTMRKVVRPPSEADDLCQIVFVRAFIALVGGKGPEDNRKLGAWMYGVARNVVSEWYRKPKADQLPEKHDIVSDEDAELRYISRQRIELVRQVIEWLDPPQRDRDIIAAIYIEEQDRDKVCRDHGIDRQYLRVLIHRALMRFKELYPEKE